MTARLAAILLALAAARQDRVPRQFDAPIFENEFLRVHIATLNTIGHYRTPPDVPQVLYCFAPLAMVRSDGSTGTCVKNQTTFVDSGWIEFRAAADPRPDLLVAELKQPPTGTYITHQDDAVRAASGAYRMLV